MRPYLGNPQVRENYFESRYQYVSCLYAHANGQAEYVKRAAKLADVAIVSVSETSVMPTAATSSDPMWLKLVQGT